MREFLSEHGIPFEDRNIRKDPAARASLLALTGEVSVPLLIVGDERILGFDQPAMERALGLA
ncbi:MAG: glutaredoxin family protein [Anaerolineae bacterium]